MSATMQLALFADGELPPSPLSAAHRAGLHRAGADAGTVAACERVRSGSAREMLVAAFCEAAPDGWLKLRCLISYLLWRRENGLAGRKGADVLCNIARGVFDIEGSNDFRLVFPRMIHLARPDLRGLVEMDLESFSDANAVLLTGWKPPAEADVWGVKPQRWEVLPP